MNNDTFAFDIVISHNLITHIKEERLSCIRGKHSYCTRYSSFKALENSSANSFSLM